MSAKHIELKTPPFNRLEALTATIVVGVLALGLGVVAVFMPASSVEKRSIDYTQLGKFVYSADTKSKSVYGEEGLQSGEPILMDAVGSVTTLFRYRLVGPADGAVNGATAMVAEVRLSQGLRREFEVSAEEKFTGRSVTVAGTLPTRQITRFVRRAQSSLGDTGFASATVVIRPVVKVEGTLGGRPIDTSYRPELAFTLDGNALALDDVADPLDPAAEAADPLKVSKDGKTAYRTSAVNTVPLLVAEPPVQAVRIVGLGVAGLCLVLGLLIARPMMRGDRPGGEAARIRSLYGSMLVEVGGLSMKDGPVADLAGIEPLVDVAKKYESVIMHVPGERGDDYLVWDNGLTYRYRSLHSSARGAKSHADRDDEARVLLTEAAEGLQQPPRS